MKHLLLSCLLLCCACSRSPQQQLQAEVSDLVKKNLNDPGSYEPGRFEVGSYTRLDSSMRAAALMGKEAEKQAESSSVMPTEAELDRSLAASKERAVRQRRLMAMPKDTYGDSIGARVTHFYRAKNAFNALMNQRAEFVVYKNGEIVRLD